MPKYEPPPDRILMIQRNGKHSRFRIEAWKYYEIVDELRARGISREDAYAAAKWASMAREKCHYTMIPNLVLSVE